MSVSSPQNVLQRHNLQEATRRCIATVHKRVCPVPCPGGCLFYLEPHLFPLSERARNGRRRSRNRTSRRDIHHTRTQARAAGAASARVGVGGDYRCSGGDTRGIAGRQPGEHGGDELAGAQSDAGCSLQLTSGRASGKGVDHGFRSSPLLLPSCVRVIAQGQEVITENLELYRSKQENGFATIHKGEPAHLGFPLSGLALSFFVRAHIAWLYLP